MQDAAPAMASTAPIRASGVGADLRALRKARGLTLAGLALEVGRSVGWLSQVERDLAEPTISDLRRLADALEQPLSLFFGPSNAPEDERDYVVRWNSRRALGSAAEGLTEQLLSPDLSGSFEIVRSVFDPGAERTERPVLGQRGGPGRKKRLGSPPSLAPPWPLAGLAANVDRRCRV